MTEQVELNGVNDGPRLQVEYWPLERLIPYARNARTHSEAQVAEIAGSIRTFGFSNPILVSEAGDIIAGHGRLAAARKLGLAEAPVVVLRGLTEFERRQLVLADNRILKYGGSFNADLSSRTDEGPSTNETSAWVEYGTTANAADVGCFVQIGLPTIYDCDALGF